MLGNIYLSLSKDVVLKTLCVNGMNYSNAIPKRTIIYILNDDIDQEIMAIDKMASCVKASILLPPPEALYKQIDGDTKSSLAIYQEYLTSQQVSEYLDTMVYAVFRGINALLYLEDTGDPFNFGFTTETYWINLLMGEFVKQYGLIVGLINHKGIITSAFVEEHGSDIAIHHMLYIRNYISPIDYIYHVPNAAFYNNFIIMNKLKYDFKPYIDIGENILDYINLLRSTFATGRKGEKIYNLFKFY